MFSMDHMIKIYKIINITNMYNGKIILRKTEKTD